MAKSKAIQPSLIGEDDKVIKGKNRAKGSSYAARCYRQLSAIVWAESRGLAILTLEIDKARMLVDEREDILRKQREAYGKRGKTNISDSSRIQDAKKRGAD